MRLDTAILYPPRQRHRSLAVRLLTDGRNAMKRQTVTFALLGLMIQGFPAANARPADLAGRTGQSSDAVKAGALIVEPPTLICLGFEWEISATTIGTPPWT